jgi:hypothetical protein
MDGSPRVSELMDLSWHSIDKLHKDLHSPDSVAAFAATNTGIAMHETWMERIDAEIRHEITPIVFYDAPGRYKVPPWGHWVASPSDVILLALLRT